MALVKLAAGMELDWLSPGEMKGLLNPAETLLQDIKGLLAADASHETMAVPADFKITVTGGTGVFSAPVFRVPQGYAATVHLFSAWTGVTLEAVHGTAGEKMGPVVLTLDAEAGSVVGGYFASSEYPVGLTWGRAQAPYLRDGQTLWISGKTTTTATSDRGACYVQYQLSPMND